MQKDDFEEEFVALQDEDVNVEQSSRDGAQFKNRRRLEQLLEAKRLRSELEDYKGSFYDDDLFGDQDD